MDIAASRQLIAQLVERFALHETAYKNGQYNETQLRREFLDPMFEALGWDVNNQQGYAEAYKDVVHEDALKIGSATKAPDYSFRIGGQRKFFVEAKKPSVNVKEDKGPAFQLRRYAWSAKLPISILTDFEEFAIYECKSRPAPTDKASTGCVKYITYREYVERWDWMVGHFSPEAIMRGALDKYAASTTNKRGTAEVDDAFLQEMEGWRDVLARHLALRNPSLTQRELNHAVQLTIDRIIFLRICEDRGIEPYERLKLAVTGVGAYSRLVSLYREADARYNSGLFHLNDERGRPGLPDTLTPSLVIDDKPLKEIVESLYYPKSPYAFSVLPASILGQAYERFLGKVIRLKPGHRAVVEDKPEVRKAGGVYYTPSYIVDYIVAQTLGPLLAEKSPKEAQTLRVLDPACGSGSFLIVAYQFLLDWHEHWYTEHDPEKHAKGKAPKLYPDQRGQWRLTTSERRHILLNNIYGVDIDSQAVEVTKLSLLLKVLEGESDQTLKSQFALFKERALPDLGDNIKCGNSLIGPDFYDNRDMSLFGPEERMRINTFDWQTEFQQVMKQGGFDAVIGNPPYVRQEGLGEFKEYFSGAYKVYHGVADLYTYFIERGVGLLRQGGIFSYIVANKWMRANYGAPLRQWLKNNVAIKKIVDFGELPVFRKAATFPSILLLMKQQCDRQEFTYSPIKKLNFESLENESSSVAILLDERAISGDSWSLAGGDALALFEKLKTTGVPLGQYVEGKIFYGIKTGLNEAFVIDPPTKEALIAQDPRSAEIIKHFAVGDDVRKYHLRDKGKYLILFPKGFTNYHVDDPKNAWNWIASNYPAIATHLLAFKDKCEKRNDKGEYWWELRACDYYGEFEKTKIVYPDIAKESRFHLDEIGFYYGNTVYMIPVNDKYLLGILNSKIIFNYYKRIAAVLGDAEKGGRLRWFTQDIIKLPVRTIDFTDPKDKALHDQLVGLVEQMLSMHRELAAARTPQERESLQRMIASTDHRIDLLVYDLYNLTKEEIAIVEGAVVDSKKKGQNHEDSPQAQRHSKALERRPDAAAEDAGVSGQHPAAGDGLHGLRGRTRKPRPAEKTPEVPEDYSPTTRFVDSSLGVKSYAELAPALALGVETVMAGLLKLDRRDIRITPEFICGLHRAAFGELFPQWAGRYRDRDVKVGRHTPPPYFEVPVLMRAYCDDLEARLANLSDSPAMDDVLMEALAFAEGRLLSIHPFLDFNGRVTRMLLFALLYRLDMPPVALVPSDKDKQEYLDALASADAMDWSGLCKIWRRRVVDTDRA